MIQVKLINNDEDLKRAFAIRQTVFVEEQSVDPEIEYDEFESVSRHFLAKMDEKPVGTARWRKTESGIKLERFAILKEYRGSGVGRQLVEAVLKDTGKPTDKMIYIHAQNQVIRFYEKLGFKVFGSEFEEADIMHHKMIYLS